MEGDGGKDEGVVNATQSQIIWLALSLLPKLLQFECLVLVNTHSCKGLSFLQTLNIFPLRAKLDSQE